MDRIGQKLPEIRVINLFLEDSVDQRVYQVLRVRCGMFEHFIGRMQPVLARAQKMLLGREPADTDLLAQLASNLDADAYSRAAFSHEIELPPPAPVPIANKESLRRAVLRLQGLLPATCITKDNEGEVLGLCGFGGGDFRVAFTQEALESVPDALPPTLTLPCYRDVLLELRREDESLPLVVESAACGPFRCSRVAWLDSSGGRIIIQSFDHLESLAAHWGGTEVSPELRIETSKVLRQEAEQAAKAAVNAASRIRQQMLNAQTSSANRRLLLEIARYLACLDEGTGDLNGLLYRQMTRDNVSQQKLTRCLQLLSGNYPEWSEDIVWDAEIFTSELPSNRKQARLIGNELEAASADPRWHATRDS